MDHDNNGRLNSATGYITPKDMLAGRQREIHAERDRRLEEARKRRFVAGKPLDVQLTPVGVVLLVMGWVHPHVAAVRSLNFRFADMRP